MRHNPPVPNRALVVSGVAGMLLRIDEEFFMGIGPKKTQYDTREQMVPDATFIIKTDGVSYPTKYAILDHIASKWTEFYGKDIGCPYWSDLALRLHTARQSKDRHAEFMEDPACSEIVPHLDGDEGKVFRHEHVVPKKVVIEMLLALESPTEGDVRKIFEKFLIGTVVTRNQDNLLNATFRSSMPPEFSKDSPDPFNRWLRYTKNEIEVFELSPGWEQLDLANPRRLGLAEKPTQS